MEKTGLTPVIPKRVPRQQGHPLFILYIGPYADLIYATQLNASISPPLSWQSFTLPVRVTFLRGLVVGHREGNPMSFYSDSELEFPKVVNIIEIYYLCSLNQLILNN